MVQQMFAIRHLVYMVSVSIATSVSIPSFLILQVILKYINLPTAHKQIIQTTVIP